MRSIGERAAPLPPEERRASIINAALPLLRKHGADVTTKQIAQAAGIAEGTVFRVFDDKDSLILAAVKQAFDPQATIDALAAVDIELPLRERLRVAVEIIAGRLDAVWELMSALRMMGPPDNHPRFKGAMPTYNSAVLTTEALVSLIRPDADELRVEVAQFARVLRLVAFAGSHPRITEDNPLKPDEIVDLLLDGLRAHVP